jgi:hypothetical protein
MNYDMYTKVLSFTHADLTFATGGSVRMPIEKGTFVLGVALVITEGFSGSELFQVGINGDLDAFVTPTMGRSGSEIRAYHSIGATAPINNSVSGSATENEVALARGYYFTTAGSIVVSTTIGAALYDPTVGEAKLFAFCVGADSNWRRTVSGY